MVRDRKEEKKIFLERRKKGGREPKRRFLRR